MMMILVAVNTSIVIIVAHQHAARKAQHSLLVAFSTCHAFSFLLAKFVIALH